MRLAPIASALVPGLACLALGCGGDGSSTSSTSTGQGGNATTTSSSSSGTGTGGQGGGVVANHEPFGSGTRLRATTLDAGGGARIFAEFYDQKLGAPCTLSRVDATTFACTPPALPTDIFLDAGCTQRVARYVDPGCPGPAPTLAAVPSGTAQCVSAYGQSASTEPSTYSYFQLGPEMASPAMVYVKDGTGNCFSYPVPAHLYPLAAPADLSQYVALHQTTPTVATDVATIRLDGDDGSFYLKGLYDTKRSIECRPSPLTDGDHCLPVSRADLSSLFGDASCTAPLYQQALSTCPTPEYGVASGGGNACAPKLSLVGVGAVVPSSSVYKGGSTCSLDAPSDADLYHFYAAGPALPTTTFPSLTSKNVGTGSLVVPSWVDAKDDVIDASALFTNPDGTFCQLTGLPDGTLFCARVNIVGLGVPYYFADAACTDVLEATPNDVCGTTTPVGGSLPTQTVCSASALHAPLVLGAVHALTPYSGTVYTTLFGGCTTYTDAMKTFYHVGPASTAAALGLPTVKLVVD